MVNTRWNNCLARTMGVLVILTSLAGCADINYRKTKVGQLDGRLTVEWLGPDCFAYRPHKTEPLTYTDSTDRVITPQTMYTDGGSIPRFLWGIPQLSPWGYAPGYILHDWMFTAHRCEIKEFEFDDSVRVLAEVIKTLMQDDRWQIPKDTLAHYAIVKGVSSVFARNSWEGGKCNNACVNIDPDQLDGGGTVLFEIDFTKMNP